MLALLNSLFDTGVYDQLYRAGLVSAKLSNYRDYYLYADALMKTQGLSKTAAFKKTAGFYGVDEKTIRNAYNSLNEE